MPRTLTRKEFFEHTRKDGDCWIWIGANDGKYGELFYKMKRWQAHRLAFFFEHKYIPKRKEIAHNEKCHSSLCINPNHLYSATHLENMRDTRLFGKLRDSQSQRKRELSHLRYVRVKNQTKEIFKLRSLGLYLEEISEQVGLCESSVCRILLGKRRAKAMKPMRSIPTDALMPNIYQVTYDKNMD